MNPEDPRDVLGPDLFGLLGQVEEPDLPASFDAGFRARLAHEEGADALGEELWDVLAAHPVPMPAARRWRWEVVLGAAAIAAVFLLVPRLREAQLAVPRPADAQIATQLDLVEHFDLLRHPDFETLTRWDGTPP